MPSPAEDTRPGDVVAPAFDDRALALEELLNATLAALRRVMYDAYIMRRTQILLPDDLHRHASEKARQEGQSLGGLVREAVSEYLAKKAPTDEDVVESILLDDPYEEPDPDPDLAVDHDHYLYGAPRRSRRGRK